MIKVAYIKQSKWSEDQESIYNIDFDTVNKMEVCIYHFSKW